MNLSLEEWIVQQGGKKTNNKPEKLFKTFVDTYPTHPDKPLADAILAQLQSPDIMEELDTSAWDYVKLQQKSDFLKEWTKTYLLKHPDPGVMYNA